jgi:hypothetical protein
MAQSLAALDLRQTVLDLAYEPVVVVQQALDCFACRFRLPIAIGDSVVRGIDRVDP